MSVNDYQDKVYRLQTRLESYSKGVGSELGKVLNARLKLLVSSMANGSTATVKEVNDIEREFAEILQNTNVDQTVIINNAIKAGVVSGYGAEKAGMALVGETASIRAINEKRLTSKAWSHIIDDSNISVEDAWDKYIGTSSKRIKTIPRMAYSQGWSMPKTIARLRQATGTDKNSAMTMARTSVMSASNVAREDVSKQLGVEQLIWKSTLDSRTTKYCQVRDGRVYEQGKGERPPGHFSCRSVMLSVPSDMTPSEFKKGLETSSRGLDGKTKIIPYTDYGSWLKTQSPAFQDEVLGKKRAGMFRSGKIDLPRMYTQNGNYLTVKQLEKRYK